MAELFGLGVRFKYTEKCIGKNKRKNKMGRKNKGNKNALANEKGNIINRHSVPRELKSKVKKRGCNFIKKRPDNTPKIDPGKQVVKSVKIAPGIRRIARKVDPDFTVKMKKINGVSYGVAASKKEI